MDEELPVGWNVPVCVRHHLVIGQWEDWMYQNNCVGDCNLREYHSCL